jgi:peptidoglycan/LPS O-acetylase OafA/YrhL
MVMWLFFPVSARAAKLLSDEQITSKIVSLYWLQIFLLLLVFLTLIIVTGDYNAAFSLSTMNPWTRYPIFHMGVLAGELSLRHVSSPLPWPCSCTFFFPCGACGSCGTDGADGAGGAVDPTQALAEDRATWGGAADRTAAALLGVTLATAAGDAALHYTTGGSILGGIWLQAIAPFAQLTVVVALTRDDVGSRSAKLLRHPLLQFLGQISMTIYLVHWPLIFYLCAVLNGGAAISWPTCSGDDDACAHETKHFTRLRTLPAWGIPVVIGAALLLAVALFYGVEEPCRKALRVVKKPPENEPEGPTAEIAAQPLPTDATGTSAKHRDSHNLN